MKPNPLDRLLAFLEQLAQAKLHYQLSNYREDAVSVEVYVPGEHWEVDFLNDGGIELERFRSSGAIEDETVLEELLKQHTELNQYSAAETITEQTRNHDDAVARK